MVSTTRSARSGTNSQTAAAAITGTRTMPIRSPRLRRWSRPERPTFGVSLRASARRRCRRAVAARLIPKQRRTGRLFARRSRGQRAGVAVVTLVLLALIWFLVDDTALRVVLTLLTVLCLPALVIVALGRRT